MGRDAAPRPDDTPEALALTKACFPRYGFCNSYYLIWNPFGVCFFRCQFMLIGNCDYSKFSTPVRRKAKSLITVRDQCLNSFVGLRV